MLLTGKRKVSDGDRYYFNSFTVYCRESPEKLTFAEFPHARLLGRLIH